MCSALAIQCLRASMHYTLSMAKMPDACSIYLRTRKVNRNEQGGNNSITLHWTAKSELHLIYDAQIQTRLGHILAMDLMKRRDRSIAPNSVVNSELFGYFDAQFFASLCLHCEHRSL